MAQAARLNLRMQKELKLLLTDPPPGASFPFLSGDSDLSSLSTIDAQIEGPEGTVYANGIFHIEIRIPERYPFQPPIVTFATPIYHPNIDNGGRICLDILNLPPNSTRELPYGWLVAICYFDRASWDLDHSDSTPTLANWGAWQPSLNISTVLTSIGLLLSEPNPDDGLMCEMSKEYKYNRHTFDQKARATTEKYANAGASDHNWRNQSLKINEDLSAAVDEKQLDEESKQEVFSSHSKPCRISGKLSLAPSRSTHKGGSDEEANDMPNPLQLDFKNMGAKVEREDFRGISEKQNPSCEKLRGGGTMRKLSIESSVYSDKRDGHDVKAGDSEHSHSLCNGRSLSITSLKSPLLHDGNDLQVHLHRDSNLADDSKITNSNRLCHVSHRLLRESLDACQTSDVNNEKMFMAPAISPSQYHSNSLLGVSNIPSSINHCQPQNFQHSVDILVNGAIDIKYKKARSVSKKLSLGFRGLPEEQKKDDKENIVLIIKIPFSSPESQKTEIVRNLSLGPLTQLQDSNEDNDQFVLHSFELLTDESQKQKPNEDQTSKFSEGIKQWGEELSIAESVIVLDSEDSEEETNGTVKSKLSIVRKPRGKRKTQA